jgi:hypothetical protein
METHLETKILGKIIGTSSGWELMDTIDILFIELTRNDLGRRFVPDFIDGNDLAVNFGTGVVAVYDDGGKEQRLSVNWAVFD